MWHLMPHKTNKQAELMKKLDKLAKRWLIVLIVFLVVFLITDLI